VPSFREVDVGQRAVRVLARVRGMDPPPADARWDDLAAAALVQPEEVDAVVDAYSDAFVRRMRPVADASETLRILAERGFAVAILSNWPLAVTVDRFAEAQGWMPFLRAVVVSQRVGTIKPHPVIFAAAEAALGIGMDADGRRSILHVGDDWAADVVGAARAGWRTAYLRGRQHDTPLPTSAREGAHGDEAVAPDLEVDELAELPGLVELDETTRSAAPLPAGSA
jgi:putative hydrolase of the HAD superfamily